jgi:hypothetical protein
MQQFPNTESPMPQSPNEKPYHKLRQTVLSLGAIVLMAILVNVALPSQSRSAENESLSHSASESKSDVNTVIVAALVGGIVTYIGAIVTSVLEKRAKTDENLRTQRLGVYRPLWKLTGILPKWPRSEDATYEKMEKFSTDLQHWYFETGGIWLSGAARKAYAALQETLEEIRETEKKGELDEEYETIRIRCSSLRTQLTKDLLSRRRG